MSELAKLLTKRAVADTLGLHEQTINRLVREGHFPPPIRTGDIGSAVRWRAADVAAWIDERAAATVKPMQETCASGAIR